MKWWQCHKEPFHRPNIQHRHQLRSSFTQTKIAVWPSRLFRFGIWALGKDRNRSKQGIFLKMVHRQAAFEGMLQSDLGIFAAWKPTVQSICKRRGWADCDLSATRSPLIFEGVSRPECESQSFSQREISWKWASYECASVRPIVEGEVQQNEKKGSNCVGLVPEIDKSGYSKSGTPAV